MPLNFSGPGISSSIKTGFNEITLQSGEAWIFSPAGWYNVKVGGYTSLQYYDIVLQTWRPVGAGSLTSGSYEQIYSDGENMRLINLTGCAVGAIVTNHGSGYTSAPAVAASAGSSLWRAVVGGAVGTSVTVSNGGSNYTYPPAVIFSAPPSGGVQATGHCTLSGAAVSTVTVDNQGAGYTSPPTITFINDPREGVNNVTAGNGAAAVCTLTGANQVTAVICIDPGVGGQATVPTLSFSGGGGSSAAATALACLNVVSITASGGSAYASDAESRMIDKITASPTWTNPATEKGWVKTRPSSILVPESAGSLTATGAVIVDGGIFTNASPDQFIITNGAGSGGTITPTFGGTTDTSYVST